MTACAFRVMAHVVAALDRAAPNARRVRSTFAASRYARRRSSPSWTALDARTPAPQASTPTRGACAARVTNRASFVAGLATHSASIRRRLHPLLMRTVRRARRVRVLDAGYRAPKTIIALPRASSQWLWRLSPMVPSFPPKSWSAPRSHPNASRALILTAPSASRPTRCHASRARRIGFARSGLVTSVMRKAHAAQAST